jgi:hypothetical protein
MVGNAIDMAVTTVLLLPGWPNSGPEHWQPLEAPLCSNVDAPCVAIGWHN